MLVSKVRSTELVHSEALGVVSQRLSSMVL